MPVEMIKCTNGDIYFPYDGAWDTKEDDEIFAEVEKTFNELKLSNNYLALIKSHDIFTHGYWVELKKQIIKYPDHILKEYSKENIQINNQ